MCTTCGCSDGTHVTYTDPHDRSHPHDHDHDHAHPHDHGHGHGRTVALEQDLLAKNQILAERNRGWFEGREVAALNLMSSPGSGKTTLLERTIAALRGAVPLYVIEGDQATTHDAERIRAAGCPVIQVNTGTGCHLETDMLARGVA
jgi:hydrogenase nickel incorporation protein HypB